MKQCDAIKPAVLVLAEAIVEEQAGGHYDEATSTWSDRNYELVSSKKHNEDM